MNKLLGKTSRKITSIINIFLVIFQNFVPLFFLTTPVTASTDLHSANVSEITLAFNSDSNELLMSGNANEAIDYVLTYSSSDEDAVDNAITGTAEVTENRFEEKLYIGSCSTEECTPDSFDHGSIVFNNADYEANFRIDNETLWLSHDNVATVARVSKDVTYKAPQNDQVTVTFTELPENPGTLSIKEIILSDEQVESLGALSNVAYDITSSMENGSFEYDLVLPVPEGSSDTAKVVFVNSVSELDQVREVDSSIITDGKAVTQNLNHFTLFIITDDQASYSAPWIDYATQGYLNTGVHYPTNVNPGETATWDFSTLTPGTYRVYVSWSTHSNRTTVAPYNLTYVGGAEPRVINQEQLADQVTTGSSAQWSNWYYYGEYSFDAASNLVLTGVTNTSGSDYVIADEVMLANMAIGPSELWVDDNYDINLSNDGHIWQYDAFDSIQEAVDVAADGATIHVLAGDYQEQVVINKNLDLLGENNPHLISVDSPASYKLAESSKTFEPIIFTYGGTLSGDTVSGSELVSVVIDGFDIDGNDRSTSGKRSVGVLSRNMEGAVNNNTVRNMHVGSAETFGIVIYGDSDLRVGDNLISDYARGGISISGDNASAPDPITVVINNQVSGPGNGEDVIWAPNGIQVGYGATGIVEENTVTGNGWPGPEWSGTGILIVDTSDVIVRSNIVQDNEQAIGVVDFPEILYGPVWSGVVSNIEVLNNTITSNTWGLEISNEVSNINVSGNHFSNTESDAIDVYTYGAAAPSPVGVTISGNSIESAGLDGLWVGDTVTEQVIAEKNWWGDASGPSGDGSGSGQTIIGNASYCPWLTNSDLNNPTYGGGCLSYVQGRTFVDKADNGLLLSADGDYPAGMQDDFTVRLYDDSWNLLEEQTTRTTGNVGQYNFGGLFNENTTYRVCGVERDGYVESVPGIGQHVVNTNNGSIPSQYSDAVIVSNNSSASDEFSSCWETTINDDNGAYLGVGYEIAAPYLIEPANDSVVNGSVLLSDWSDVSSADNYIYESYHDDAATQLRYNNTYTQSEKTATNVGNATFWWRVKAVDTAGNESGWSELWKVTIDNDAPDITIVKPLSNDVKAGMFTTEATIIDANDLSNVRVRFNDAVTNAIVKTYSMTNTSGDTWKYTVDSVSDLPDGDYRMRVIATDEAGNKRNVSEVPVTIDNTAPTATFITPKAGDFVRGDFRVEGTASDPNDIGRITLRFFSKGTSWPPVAEYDALSSYDGSLNWYHDVPKGDLPDGEYRMRAIIADNVSGENKKIITEDFVTIDNTRPTGQIITPADGELVNGNLNVTGHVDDNLSGIDRVEVRLRNHPGNTYRTSWQVATLDASNNFSVSIDTSLIPEDDYEVAVVAYDKAGNNKWLWPRPVVTVDRTVPTTPVMNGFLNPTLACSSVTNINYTTVDWTDSYDLNGINKYHYSIDYPLANGSGFGHWETNLSQSQHSGSLNEGLHTIKVRALDNIGLYSSWSEECSITTDWTAPDLTTDSIKYPNGTVEPDKFVTNYNTPTILGTTSDDVVLLELTVNGYTYVAAVSGTDWEAVITDVLPEGQQTMTMVATDHAGNVTTSYKDIRIDTSAPTAVHTFYKDGTAIGGFNQYYEDGKKFTGPLTYVQDVAQLSFTGEYEDQDPSAGLYWDSYVIFEAQDDGSFRFSNDGKKAFCSWRSTPNLVDISAGSVFSLIDQESFANCESSLEDGEYYMAHHIYDSATRKDIPSINQFRDVLGLRFIVDTVNPTVSATVDPTTPNGDNGWYITAPTVTLTADDDQLVDRIEYQWNSDGWTTYSIPLVATEGTHTLYYRSYDAAENVSDEGSIVVKFDATSPNPGPENVKVSSFSLPTGILEWDLASDGISGIRGYDVSWKLKGNDELSFGKNVDSTTKETELHSLTDGEWEIRVKALDEAGNWTEVLLLFKIDGASGESGGTTTTSSAPLEGTGGAILGVTTAGAGGTVLGDKIEEGEEKDSLSGKEVDLEGKVLGSSNCNAWSNYLPLILLALQVILIIGFGLVRREPGSIKLIVTAIITLITIATFYFFKDGNCYLEKSALSVIAQWFVLLSPITGFVTKTIVGGFTEEA